MGQVDAQIFFQAKETESDWTTASGSMTSTVYTAESGLEIERIVGHTESSYSYRDNDHALDRFPGSGPVSSYTFMGDGGGDDAGVHTRVEVAFNSIRLELNETGDCISERAIRSAVEHNLMSLCLELYDMDEDEKIRQIQRKVKRFRDEVLLFLDNANDAGNIRKFTWA